LLDLLREASFHREAKRDLVGRKAYRLLTSLHDCFGQISEKILTTDRISREMTELEKKLAAMASRSLNVDKLQADLDAIVKENECLELRLAENPWVILVATIYNCLFAIISFILFKHSNLHSIHSIKWEIDYIYIYIDRVKE